MVWNEKLKREIPEGWNVMRVEEIIEPIERGISYSSSDIETGIGLPMVNLACFAKDGSYRTGEMKFFAGEIHDSKTIHPLDMLIACTDMTQDADIIGRPIFVTSEYKKYTFSTDLALIRPRLNSKMFLYHSLRTAFYHTYIRPFASGTTVKHLKIIGVGKYPMPVPDEKLLQRFDEILIPIQIGIHENINKIHNLTKLRDELLPMLMNGQVSVNYDL